MNSPGSEAAGFIYQFLAASSLGSAVFTFLSIQDGGFNTEQVAAKVCVPIRVCKGKAAFFASIFLSLGGCELTAADSLQSDRLVWCEAVPAQHTSLSQPCLVLRSCAASPQRHLLPSCSHSAQLHWSSLICGLTSSDLRSPLVQL